MSKDAKRSWKLSDEEIKEIHQWATSGYSHAPDFDTDRAVAAAAQKNLAEKVLYNIRYNWHESVVDMADRLETELKAQGIL